MLRDSTADRGVEEPRRLSPLLTSPSTSFSIAEFRERIFSYGCADPDLVHPVPYIDISWAWKRRAHCWINRTPPKTPTCNFLWPLVVAASSLVRPPFPLPPTDLRYLTQMLSEFFQRKVLILNLKLCGICENSRVSNEVICHQISQTSLAPCLPNLKGFSC